MSVLAFAELDRRIKKYAVRCGKCIIWQGSLGYFGRAKTKALKPYSEKKYDLVARLILAKRLGRDLYRHEYACHRCDNPACIAPWHIYLGDAATNNADTLKRGRRVNGHGKTNAKIIDEIRCLYRETDFNQTEIGELYNISQMRVSQIIRLGR